MKQFQQAMDAVNVSKCQQCDQALLTILTQITKLEPIEFSSDKEEYGMQYAISNMQYFLNIDLLK